jgi:hypothetical protein
MLYGKDRREAKRISYICEVECDASGISRLATRINDLSTTGAFIDSMTCFAVGTILHLTFHVKNVRIETTAEVRYSMSQIGMGVLFLDLKPEHVAALESLIEGKPLVLPPSSAATAQAQSTSHSKGPEMLTGNFAVVSMFDIIQIIENNRLGGALTVDSLAANGNIHFDGGLIVGAVSGLKSGIEALKDFLDVTEGSFEFRRSSTSYPRTINAGSNMSLMLDLLRVKDEKTAGIA